MDLGKRLSRLQPLWAAFGVWSLIVVQQSFGLQIPCLHEFDRSCNLVPYSYCDTESKECECLPRFKEKDNRCIPELNAFCDKPGRPCDGLPNSVCSPAYRCICETGFENKDDSCVPSVDFNLIDDISSLFPVQSVLGDNRNSHQAHRQPQTNNNDYDIQWNPNIMKDQRKELIRRILQNAQLRKLLIQHLLSQGGGTIDTNIPTSNGKGQQLPLSNQVVPPKQTGLRQECQTIVECSVTIPNSVCYRGRCQCGPNFIENTGKCFPGLGKPCNAVQPCFVRYSTCGERGVCQCKTGFRNSGGQCIPGIGNECMMRGQPCFGVPESYCNENEMCACRPGFKEKDGLCEKYLPQPNPGTRCSTDCGALSHSYCNSTGHCACLPGYTEQNGQCKRIGRPGATCYSSNDCASQDPNTWCSQSHCICIRGYVLLLGKCYPSLGSRCSLAMPCGVANSYCSSLGICQCKDNSVQRGEKCIRLRKLFDQALTTTDKPYSEKECAIIGSPCIRKPNTLCNLDLQCVCQIGFTKSAEGCVKESPRNKAPLHVLPWLEQAQSALKLIQPTSTEPQRLVLEETRCNDRGRPCVGIQNSLCTGDGICICVPGHVKTASGCKSVENVVRLTEPLIVNDEPTACSTACDADVNAVCTPMGTCACKQGYARAQGTCFPALGAACSKDDWCATPNSHCNPAGTCACMVGHMQYRNQCKPTGEIESSKKGKKLECWVPGKPCLATEKAVCNKTYQCQCINGFHKHVDGSCIDNTHHVELSQNSPRCLIGFVRVGGHCLPGVLLGYSCHDSRQCSEVTEGSVCQHGKCACKKGYITFNATTCLAVGPLESGCSVSEECSSPESRCIDGRCQCRQNYIPLLGLCFAGLGQECSDLSESASKKCGVKNSVCVQNACRCRHVQLHNICW